MPTNVDLRPLHRRALDLATPLLARVVLADLSRPTPCADWDLRALLGHVIGQNHGFALAVQTSDAPRSADAPADRQVRLVEIGTEMRFPVATVVGVHLVDTVVHTWDIATALGTSFRPDSALIDATLTLAREIPDGSARTRPGAAFGPVRAVPSSDDWEATLALLGRG